MCLLFPKFSFKICSVKISVSKSSIFKQALLKFEFLWCCDAKCFVFQENSCLIIYQYKMNRTLFTCYRPVVEFYFLVWTQVVVLTVTNSLVMVANIIANILIIFVLFKTKQIANNTCKLFFVLSVSDLMVGICLKLTYTYMTCKKLLTYGYTCVYCCIFSAFINVYNCNNGN